MRTTLDIDIDVLQAAKEIARTEKTTAGRVISSMFRKGFSSRHEPVAESPRYRNGIPQLPSRGEIITMEHIQKIMDEEGI
ncbi:MAG: hypothetical protein ABL999_07320 [Pyrinomonadaceae bacterium]